MPDDDFDEQNQGDSTVIKDLRKKAEKADQYESENNDLRKRLALSEAGLAALNPIQQKALIASHDGELNAEALKATAKELGFTSEPAAAEPEPQVPADEQAALSRVQQATAGATPSEAQAKTLEDEINAATSKEEVDAILAREGRLADA